MQVAGLAIVMNKLCIWIKIAFRRRNYEPNIEYFLVTVHAYYYNKRRCTFTLASFSHKIRLCGKSVIIQKRNTTFYQASL